MSMHRPRLSVVPRGSGGYIHQPIAAIAPMAGRFYVVTTQDPDEFRFGKFHSPE